MISESRTSGEQSGDVSARRARVNLHLTPAWIAIILVGHGVYGLILGRSAALATIHSWGTFAIGIWLAMTSRMKNIAVICAYMAGSEILWRIGKASVPWEFVKYAIGVLILITLSRVRRLQWNWAAVGYFALLIPSALMSLFETDLEVARQQISFNVSGPLLFAAATWFFSQLRFSRGDLQRVFVALIAPVMSLAFITITKAASADALTFGDASNFQTSGGYGPNQVSTALGLGLLLALLLAGVIGRGMRSRLLFAAVAVLLGVQSALTFSRGGLAGALGALIITVPLLLHGTRTRLAVLAGGAALFALVTYVVLPRLDALTEGAIVTRFTDTDPTGRDELIRTELESFAEHPVLGVGPGSLDKYGNVMSSTHTEFTRLLAQHGSLGALALLIMLLIGWRDVFGQMSSEGRAIALALVAWSMLTMTHAAMRLAVTPFVFGLAAAHLLVVNGRRDEESKGTDRSGRAVGNRPVVEAAGLP